MLDDLHIGQFRHQGLANGDDDGLDGRDGASHRMLENSRGAVTISTMLTSAQKARITHA
jgi:hypothetical protein